jgi:hypothetical protein
MLIIFAPHQADAQSARDESSNPGYLGVQLMAGAFVGKTEPDGPAQAAGIEPGDGRPVSCPPMKPLFTAACLVAGIADAQHDIAF